MAQTAHNVGITVQQPKKACLSPDANCPFHGSIKIRGRQHTGTIVSTKMRRSAVVQWEFRRFLPKYERYEKRLTKITVHAPDCMDAKEGDVVKIMETRPLSKTKHYVIIENLGQEKGYSLRAAALEQSKTRRDKKAEGKEELAVKETKEGAEQ